MSEEKQVVNVGDSIPFFKTTKDGNINGIDISDMDVEGCRSLFGISDDGRLGFAFKENAYSKFSDGIMKIFKIENGKLEKCFSVPGIRGEFIGDYCAVKCGENDSIYGSKYALYDNKGTKLTDYEYDSFKISSSGKIFGKKDERKKAFLKGVISLRTKTVRYSFTPEFIPIVDFPSDDEVLTENFIEIGVENKDTESFDLKMRDENLKESVFKVTKKDFPQFFTKLNSRIKNLDFLGKFGEIYAFHSPYLVFSTADFKLNNLTGIGLKYAFFHSSGKPVFLKNYGTAQDIPKFRNGIMYFIYREAFVHGPKLASIDIVKSTHSLTKLSDGIYSDGGKKYFSSDFVKFEDELISMVGKNMVTPEIDLESKLISVTSETEDYVTVNGSKFKKKILKIK